MEGKAGSSAMTVEEFLNQWLEVKCERLKPSSQEAYRRAVNRNIVPVLGAVRLSDLDKNILQDFVHGLRASGLSDKSVWDINIKLNAALQWAGQQGYLERTDFGIRCKYDASAKLRTLTDQERASLERYLSANDPVRVGLLLCLKTGLQIGEISALLWSDVDLERRQIKVDKRMQRIAARDQKNSRKKTSVSILPTDLRCVPVPADVAALLGGMEHDDQGYFLTGEAERYLEPRVLQIRLKRCLRECGLSESINFNMFRSTFIRSSLEKGMDIYTVCRIIGAKRLAHIGDKYREYADGWFSVS